MARRNTKRRKGLSRLLIAVAALLVTGYFSHHAIYGRYGLNAHARLSSEAETLNRQLAALKARRDRLATDVRHLQDPPHPDLIEEGARRILGYEKPATIRLSAP